MVWLKVIIFGLIIGSFYTLIALGFALIFGVTRTFNLAHGELLVLAGYLSYFLNKHLGLNFFYTLPLAVLFSIVLGYILNGLFKLSKEPKELNTIVLSFGLALALQNGMLILFSGNYRLVKTPYFYERLGLGGLNLSYGQLFVLILSLLAIFLLFYLKRKTFLGKALWATIQDGMAASMAGIDAQRMHLIAFLLGFSLIGLSGPIYATLKYIHPSAGLEATLLAITITIFAGVGKMFPIILGGWLLGLIESMGVMVFGTGWREALAAIFLIGLLMLYPQGIRGKE